MAGFDMPEDRLAHEAEELMRQRRFQDAAARYEDLLARSPTDLWANLGRVSALECAGQLDEARSLLEYLQQSHRRSASFHRFRHLFFVRREDFSAATASQRALNQGDVIDEGIDDQLAELYFNQGRYHEAVGELGRLLATGIEDAGLKASVLARLGACQRQLGDAVPARTHLLAALELEPGNHWTLSELAEAERALGEIAAARTRYREALEAAPDDHWTRGHLAQLEHEDGRSEEAIRLYEEVISRDPQAAWARVELAQVLTETAPQRSASLCREALDRDPRNPWAHAQLGALARRAGEWSTARAHYLHAHQGAPAAVWVLHELADCARHLGRMEEAYGHLDRALAEDPYHAVTYGYRADFLRSQGRTAEALAHLVKALELDGNYAWAWRERAELDALAGRHHQAEEAWRTASELEPDAALNDGLKAFLLRSQDRRQSALPWLERAVERQPGYLWAWREQIELHLSADQPVVAEVTARAALAALPANAESAPLWGMLAESLRRQLQRDPRQRVAAIEAVTKALGLDDSIPQLWAIRAELAVEVGDFPMAEAAARAAVERSARVAGGASGPEYLTLLAQVLVACDRLAEAEAELTELLTRRPVVTLQPTWELAALVAERLGRLARARELCALALAGPCPDDVRLRVRRARLGLLLQEEPKTVAQALDGLFEADPGLVPWRDAAHIFAQAGRPLEARRAAFLALDQAPEGPARRRARVQLAEIELALGEHAVAACALEEVLAAEPDHLQARILGAALAEHRGDRRGATSHLQHLDSRIRSLLAGHEPRGATDHEPAPALLRQLAALYERSGEANLADRLWTRLSARLPADGEIAAERAAFRARQQGLDAVRSEVAAAEALLVPGSEPHQRLLRELAISEARAGRHEAALQVLIDHDQVLDQDGHLLLARVALGAGQGATARRHLEQHQSGFSNAAGDAAAVLLARARLAAGDLDAAAREAEALWLRHERRHEEAATVLAEAHACRGRFAEALQVLGDPVLSTQWTLERALLGAVVALEERGVPWCLAALGRHGVPEPTAHDLPLVRLFAAAWPGAWTEPSPSHPVTPQDLAAVPPFPRLAPRLAQALIAAGQPGLACEHLLAVLAFQRRQGLPLGNPLERHLRLATISALCHAGRRLVALRVAVAGRSLQGVLRCCWR